MEIVEFNPSPKMKLYAFSRAQPQFSHLDDEQLCKTLGLGGKFLDKCRNAYDPHFTEWLEENLPRMGPNMRKLLLDQVGFEKAVEGDFAFWKAYAIKEKLIDPDQANLNVIPPNLGNYGNLNESQIQSLIDAEMAALRNADGAGIQLPDGKNE